MRRRPPSCRAVASSTSQPAAAPPPQTCTPQETRAVAQSSGSFQKLSAPPRAARLLAGPKVTAACGLQGWNHQGQSFSRRAVVREVIVFLLQLSVRPPALQRSILIKDLMFTSQQASVGMFLRARTAAPRFGDRSTSVARSPVCCHGDRCSEDPAWVSWACLLPG